MKSFLDGKRAEKEEKPDNQLFPGEWREAHGPQAKRRHERRWSHPYKLST